MKKITMGLMLSLISIVTANACHVEPLGYCGDKSYFITKDFNPNSVYHFRNLAGDTILTLTAGEVAPIDSIFSLPVLPDVPVFMKYKYFDSTTWVGWNYQAHSLTTQYENCGGVLAIAITDVVATLKDGNLKVSFTSLDENQVMKYQIVGSTDEKNYDTLLKAIDPTGAGEYTVNIPMPNYAKAIAGFMGAGAFFFFFVVRDDKKKKLSDKTKKLFALMSIFAITFIFVSCSKEKIEPKADLTKITSIRVVAVQTTGAQVFSDVKPIK